MKCKNCGKNFNTTAFGDTYCPYCGTKVSKEDEEKIRQFEYNQGDIVAKKVLKVFKYIGIGILLLICAYFFEQIIG